MGKSSFPTIDSPPFETPPTCPCFTCFLNKSCYINIRLERHTSSTSSALRHHLPLHSTSAKISVLSYLLSTNTALTTMPRSMNLTLMRITSLVLTRIVKQRGVDRLPVKNMECWDNQGAQGKLEIAIATMMAMPAKKIWTQNMRRENRRTTRAASEKMKPRTVTRVASKKVTRQQRNPSRCGTKNLPAKRILSALSVGQTTNVRGEYRARRSHQEKR